MAASAACGYRFQQICPMVQSDQFLAGGLHSRQQEQGVQGTHGLV